MSSSVDSEALDFGQRSDVSLRDMARVLFKFKNKILLVVGVALLAALGYLLYVDSVFEAEVKILVLLGPEKFAAMEALHEDDFSVVFQERGENIANEMEIIRDKAIDLRVLERFKQAQALAEAQEASFLKRALREVREVVRDVKEVIKWPLYQIGLSHRLTDDELMLLELQSALHVEFLEITDIIRATFRHSDPEVAAFILNAYVEEYLTHRMQVLGNTQSQGFYEEQIERSAADLSDIEERLEQFRNEGAISSLPVQRDLILHEITRVQSDFNANQRELKQLQIAQGIINEVWQAGGQWIETPDLKLSLPDYSSLDQHYMELFAQRSELLDTFTESSREVRSLDQQIAHLRDEKARNLLAALQTRKTLIEQTLALFDEELKVQRAQLQELDSRERRLNALERERNLVETSYLTYARKAEELRISRDLTQRQFTSVRVISPAVAPALPASPNKKLIVILAAFLGVFLGLAYAAIAQFFSHTFEREADVERVLGIPLLATFAFTDRSD